MLPKRFQPTAISVEQRLKEGANGALLATHEVGVCRTVQRPPGPRAGCRDLLRLPKPVDEREYGLHAQDVLVPDGQSLWWQGGVEQAVVRLKGQAIATVI